MNVNLTLVLVAASPCALAIAVPVTVISAIGSASKFGVVIKSGEAFEQLGTIRRVAFDKTGTLTRNQPEVVALRAAVAAGVHAGGAAGGVVTQAYPVRLPRHHEWSRVRVRGVAGEARHCGCVGVFARGVVGQPP